MTSHGQMKSCSLCVQHRDVQPLGVWLLLSGLFRFERGNESTAPDWSEDVPAIGMSARPARSNRLRRVKNAGLAFRDFSKARCDGISHVMWRDSARALHPYMQHWDLRLSCIGQNQSCWFRSGMVQSWTQQHGWPMVTPSHTPAVMRSVKDCQLQPANKWIYVILHTYFAVKPSIKLHALITCMHPHFLSHTCHVVI